MLKLISNNNANFTGNQSNVKNLSNVNNTFFISAVKALGAAKVNYSLYNNSSIILKLFVGTRTLHGINGVFEITCNTKNVINLNLCNKQKFAGSFGQTCNANTQGIKAINLQQFKSFLATNNKAIKTMLTSVVVTKKPAAKTAATNNAVALHTALSQQAKSKKPLNQKAMQQLIKKFM